MTAWHHCLDISIFTFLESEKPEVFTSVHGSTLVHGERYIRKIFNNRRKQLMNWLFIQPTHTSCLQQKYLNDSFCDQQTIALDKWIAKED